MRQEQISGIGMEQTDGKAVQSKAEALGRLVDADPAPHTPPSAPCWACSDPDGRAVTLLILMA